MGKPFYKEKPDWIFAVLLIFAAAIVFLIARDLSNRSADSTHDIGNVSVTASAKPVQTSGKYISFKYPSNYMLKPAAPDGAILEDFSLATSGVPFVNMSISIHSLPSGNLNDSKDYYIRTQDPNRFQLSEFTAGGQTYPVYADSSGGYQKTAFIIHGKLLATVSLSSVGGDNEQALDNDLKVVLASLAWR